MGRLSGHLSKIEFLCKLTPLLETDDEYRHALSLILTMVDDYATSMRADLNRLMNPGAER